MVRGNRTATAALADALLSRLGSHRFDGMVEEHVMCVLVTAWAGEIDDELRSHLQEVCELLPLTYVPQRVEFLMMLLSMFTGPPGDFMEAYGEVTRKSASLSPWQAALAMVGSAFVLDVLGEVEQALAHFERSLAAFKAIGERWGTVLVLSGLGSLHQNQGDHRKAHALADEALATARELGAGTEIAEALCRRGDALLSLGDPAGAAADYELAAELSRRYGSMETVAWAYLGMGEVELSRGDVAGAHVLLTRAREECPAQWYSTETTRTRIDAALTEVSRMAGER